MSALPCRTDEVSTDESGCGPGNGFQQPEVLTAMGVSDLMSDLVWSTVHDSESETEAFVRRVQWSAVGSPGAAPSWQPSVNVYRVSGSCLVCVELAGVVPRALQLRVGADRLLIRGRRAPPEPKDGVAKQVLAMEIDHGRFEREIRFPFAVDVTAVAVRHENGLVWIRLPLLHSSDT